MGATFTIGLHLDDGQLRQKLAGIHKEIEDTFNLKGGLERDLTAATRSAKVLEQALLKATTNKGISFSAFNSELKKAGMSAAQLTSNLAQGGARFRESLNAANAALALSNRQTITLNKHLQAAAYSLKQSFKYTVAQTAWRQLANIIRQSVTWVTNLNDAVNNIGVVTGKTGAQLDKVTQQAIKGSRELRVAAQEYAEGALIFYQQGLSDKEVQRRNEITIKAAKAAGESIEDMSSQLTAIWNTYKMNADQQMKAASVGAKMAATTAVQFKDIAEAMRSAAAPAAQMGVSYESLASIIATVGDTTQQSASVIGNAFKTIFSRFQQLQVDGTDGEISLKKLSAQIQAMGVQVLDTTGNLLPVDKILQQIGEKWDKWTTKQQTAMAQLAGGTRQYGQFLALMDNYDKYLSNLRAAEAETGATLEQQYKQAIDSIEVRRKNAAEAWKRAASNLFDVDNIKEFYAITEKLGSAFGVIARTISGIPGALLIAAALLRERILPTLIRTKSFVQEAWQNRTTEGRQRSINATYDEKASYYRNQISSIDQQLQNDKLSGIQKTQLERAKQYNELLLQQNENERKIALNNEEINTLLHTANEELRVGLELRQKSLTETQRLQSAVGDLMTPWSRQNLWASISATQKSVNLYGADLKPGRQRAIRRGAAMLGHGLEAGAQFDMGMISAQEVGQRLQLPLLANAYWGTRADYFKPKLAEMSEEARNLTNDKMGDFLPRYLQLAQEILEANTAGNDKLEAKTQELIQKVANGFETIIAALQAEQFSNTGILKPDEAVPQQSQPSQRRVKTTSKNVRTSTKRHPKLKNITDVNYIYPNEKDDRADLSRQVADMVSEASAPQDYQLKGFAGAQTILGLRQRRQDLKKAREQAQVEAKESAAYAEYMQSQYAKRNILHTRVGAKNYRNQYTFYPNEYQAKDYRWRMNKSREVGTAFAAMRQQEDLKARQAAKQEAIQYWNANKSAIARERTLEGWQKYMAENPPIPTKKQPNRVVRGIGGNYEALAGGNYVFDQRAAWQQQAKQNKTAQQTQTQVPQKQQTPIPVVITQPKDHRQGWLTNQEVENYKAQMAQQEAARQAKREEVADNFQQKREELAAKGRAAREAAAEAAARKRAIEAQGGEVFYPEPGQDRAELARQAAEAAAQIRIQKEQKAKANDPTRLKNRIKAGFAKEKENKAGTLGAAAASAMTGLTLSNTLDTLGDSSATAAEKIGSAVGMMGSLSSALYMIEGPIGAVILAISLAIPIISKLHDWITGAREREIQHLNEQINALNDSSAAYQQATETLENTSDGSVEHLKALNDQTEAFKEIQNKLRANPEAFNDIIVDGQVQIEKLDEYIQQLGKDVEKIRAEETIEEEEKKIKADLSNLRRYADYRGTKEDLLNAKSVEDLRAKFGHLGTVEYTDEQLQTILNRVMLAKNEIETIQQAMDAANSAFLGIDNLADLEAKRQSILSQEEFDFNYTDYAEALMALGNQYDFAADEVKAFRNALMAGNDELSENEKIALDAAEANLRLAITAGEGAKKFGLNGASVAAQAKQIAKSLNLEAESAANVAVADQRLNRGLKTLKENITQWKTTINGAIDTNQDWGDTIVGLTDVIGDLINATEDFVLPDSFDIKKNFSLIEQAATGAESAILKLGGAIAQAQIESSTMNYGIATQLYKDWDPDTLDWYFDALKNTAKNTVAEIQNSFKDLKPGDPLKGNVDTWVETLNEYARLTGMTKDQMNAYLSEIGVQANVEVTDVPVQATVPQYREHAVKEGEEEITWYEELPTNGRTTTRVIPHVEKFPIIRRWTEELPAKPVGGKTQVAQIGSGKDPKKPKLTYVGKPAGASSFASAPKGKGGGGGSGGGKGSKFKPKNAKSVAASGKLGERYANINSYIDKNTKSIDKLSKAQEDAWGSASYRNLLAINNLLVKQGQYLKQLRAEAKDYLKKDLADLQRIMRGEWKEGDPWDKDKGYGLVTQLLYDEETGIIHNWENVLAEMEVFRKNYGDEVDRLNAQWDAEKNPDNETLEDRIAAAQQEYDSYMEFVEHVQSAYKTEQDTVGVLYDTAEKQVELIKDWMSKMIELAQIKLDLKISISDRDIQTLDHLIDLWGDLGTQMSKTWENYKKISAENVQKSLANITNGNEMLDLLNMLKPESSYHDRFVELFDEEAWNDYLQNGGLPTSVIEQLHSAYNDAFSYMVEAQSNFRSMLQEWLKLFQYYLDKFQFISKKLSTNTNILDMFTTLMEVTGKSNTVTGSDALYRIAQTKYDTNFTAALLAKGQYQFASNALEKAQESLDLFYEQHGTDVSKYTQAELIYYQELQDQIKQVTEAKDQAFDDVTNSIKDMAGSVTEMLEAVTNNLSAVLFENLGGLAYDTSSGTELYGMKKENNNIFLSEIEKNYDLDKLKNTIEAYLEDNDVDNTEYLKILDEINEKRQKGVEITQADYDVLLKRFELQQAIDAYEDSQRFKNTMRLTRDASGNWSYVYSGNNAEDENTLRQNVADKEFELHQAQMNALDEYQEKYYETAMALIDLWYNVDKTRYHSDEKYRQNVDEQSRLLVERLDSYKGIIVKIEEETGTAHSDTMLAWITGTNDGLTTMEGLHDSYLGYIGEFKDGLISESGKILDNFNGDVTEVGDGLDKLEGDYGDLEDVVYDKTDDMIEENADLRDEIHELVESGTEDMNALTETIRISAESMIADLNAVEAAVESLREALDKYDNEALSRIEGYEDTRNYAGYAGRDALANNILGQMATASDSEREALFDSWWDSYDETEKSKWRNKINSVGDLSGRTFSDMTPSEQKQYAKELLFKLADKIRNGTFDAETDLPLVDSRFLSSSASGNYFRKPGITTIAENAPEIVLNPEDTRNILAAVRYVRLAVNNGLSQSASLGFGVAAHNASIGAMNSGGFTIQTPVQQEVQIDANFPNVNVAAEVEDALDMLILQASQYAGNRQ